MSTRVSNRTSHPGKIILDNTQKRRTSAQVQADTQQKNLEALEAKQAYVREYQDKIAKAAAFEDRMQREELAREASKIHPDLATETR